MNTPLAEDVPAAPRDSNAAVPALQVWNRIVAELAELQDQASPGEPGAVVNSICRMPYVVDTCSAARVFATEYRRTDDLRWRQRAESALAAARARGPLAGIAEPAWNVLGWHDVPECLSVTGMALDACWGAMDLLGSTAERFDAAPVLDFLLRCRGRHGGFAHNALAEGSTAPEVQNTTATALNILAHLAGDPNAAGHPLYRGLAAARARLREGQCSDGFWPYHHPGGRLRESLDRPPFNRILRPRRFFAYRRRGDVMHHLMTLHFAAGYFATSQCRTDIGMLESAWNWIRKHLVRDTSGGLAFDWAPDVPPEWPVYSNSLDTNAYFLLIGTIPQLVTLDIATRNEAGSIADGVLAHVAAHLLPAHARPPCITPYEGPRELVRNILPMFEQSVAWKGCLLARYVLARDQGAIA